MKKIFLICINHIENWDVFIPPDSKDISQKNISALLLHKKQDLEKMHVSQVWNLSETDTISKNIPKNISYQDFLEQVFLHDLAIVI
jgi:hypothetical protein